MSSSDHTLLEVYLTLVPRGMFMNKYVFPGADASCALNWVIGRVSRSGLELGHLSAECLLLVGKHWIRDQERRRSRCALFGYHLALVQELARERGQGCREVWPQVSSILVGLSMRPTLIRYRRLYRIWAYFLASSTIIARYVSSNNVLCFASLTTSRSRL